MHPIDRRMLLKGVSLGTGATLLAPLLTQLGAQAAGTKPLPKRVVFVVQGNGVPWEQIQPVGVVRNKHKITTGGYTGRGGGEPREGVTDIALDDKELPKALEPIAFAKDRLTILQGLSGKMNGGGHSSDFGCLGAYSAKGGVGSTGLPFAETIDFALVKKLSAVFPQIGVGITDHAEDTIIYNCSASGAGKALPTQCRPDLAYQALLVGATDEAAHKAKAMGIVPPAPRSVRVDLLTGKLLDANAKIADPQKIPGRPFVDPPTQGNRGNQATYIPSLDPIRLPGKFAE